MPRIRLFGDGMKASDMNVVIPGFGLTSLGTARCLTGHHYKIFTLGRLDSQISKMPFYYSSIPARKKPLPREITITQGLLDIGKSFRTAPTLLLTEDEHVMEVSSERKILSETYRFLLPSPDVIRDLMIKVRFAETADRQGYIIPKTLMVRSQEELSRASRQLSFPMMVKPYLLHSKKIHDKTELEFFAKRLTANNWKSVVAQEWIPGGDDSIYFCFTYFDENSKPIASLTAQKIRQWPPNYGTTSLCRTVDNAYVTNETIKIFKELGLEGAGSMEYKYDEVNDTYYIMEPTIGRFDQQVAIGRPAGVNLPLIAAKYITEGRVPNVQQKDDVWWIFEKNDYRSKRHPLNRNSSEGFWRHLVTAESRVLFSLTDPRPFIVMLADFIGYKINRTKHIPAVK